MGVGVRGCEDAGRIWDRSIPSQGPRLSWGQLAWTPGRAKRGRPDRKELIYFSLHIPLAVTS